MVSFWEPAIHIFSKHLSVFRKVGYPKIVISGVYSAGPELKFARGEVTIDGDGAVALHEEMGNLEQGRIHSRLQDVAVGI